MTLSDEPEPFFGFEVAIDNASQVNVLHPRFLTNLRPGFGSYKGVDKSAGPVEENVVGDLAGFFECVGSESVRLNILSQDDVESLYKVTYVQGDSFTVHMKNQDLIFRKKNKLYVADMSAWIAEDQLEEASKPLMLATVDSKQLKRNSKRLEGLTKKEALGAVEAKEFVRRSGYPSELEAVKLVQDGNFDRMPIEVGNVRASFSKLGEHTELARGKMTKRKISWAPEKDSELVCNKKMQTMISDIMEMSQELYLITLLVPLELTVCTGVTSTKEEALGLAIQAQLDLVRN